MRTRRFGRVNVEIPVIGLGTWNIERDDRAQAIAHPDLGEVEAIAPGQVESFGALPQRLGGTPRQLALAYLTRRSSVLAIPKAARVAHVEELAGADRVPMDSTSIAAIEARFPLAPWRGLPMM